MRWCDHLVVPLIVDLGARVWSTVAFSGFLRVPGIKNNLLVDRVG